jgi:hypothetical protein
MDKQIMFFLMLALLFMFKGIISMDPLMQLAGIVLLLLPVYDQFFNKKENEKAKNNYVRKFNFVGFLGNIDLILGVLLITRVLYEIIPLDLILFLTIIFLLKALLFVWGGDIASVIDILSSVVIFSLIVIEIPLIIIVIISIYLIQKGILSFF